MPPAQQLLDPEGAAEQALWQSLSTEHAAVQAPPPEEEEEEEPPPEEPLL